MQKVLRRIKDGGPPSESPAKGRFDIMKKLAQYRSIILRCAHIVQYLYALITKIMGKNSFSRRKVDNKSNNLSRKGSVVSYPCMFSKIKISFLGTNQVTHSKAR